MTRFSFLDHEDLVARGLTGSRASTWRAERAGRFPKRTPFSSQRNGWAECVIDAYSRAITLGHSPEEATAIAEAERQRLAETLQTAGSEP
jgi:hypothetical protein